MATGGSSGAVSSKQTQKIRADFEAVLADLPPFLKDLKLEIVDGLNQLSGVMIGPDGSDYAGGHFRFSIGFPPEYPFKPPEFVFSTAICHPNVDTRTGTACHDQLMATWAPSIKLKKLLTEMHSLLAEPNYDTPLEGDSVTGKISAKARQWTKDFAQPQN